MKLIVNTFKILLYPSVTEMVLPSTQIVHCLSGQIRFCFCIYFQILFWTPYERFIQTIIEVAELFLNAN